MRRAGVRACLLFIHQHGQQIGRAGILARLQQQRGDLTAMMRLVVEQMRDHPPERIFALPTTGDVAQRFSEPLRCDGGRPCVERLVGALTFRAQLGEVGEQLLVERAHAVREEPVGRYDAVQAAEPDPVGDEQVIQGPVDRLEERTAIAFALLVAEERRGGIHLLVHPAVVASHRADNLRRHGSWTVAWASRRTELGGGGGGGL